MTASKPSKVQVIGGLIVLVVLIALALDTTTRSDSAPRVTGRAQFDPVAYGEKNYEAKVVPEILKTMSLRPDFLTAIDEASRMHFTDGALTRAQHEMIASYVSALNRCRY